MNYKILIYNTDKGKMSLNQINHVHVELVQSLATVTQNWFFLVHKKVDEGL